MFFFCKYYEKYWNLTQSSGTETLQKWTVSADPQAIRLKICGNYLLMENLHTRKSDENKALYPKELRLLLFTYVLFSAQV